MHYKIKELHIAARRRMSLRKHQHRDEYWTVVIGSAKVTLGDEELFLSQGESVHVSSGVAHRIENPNTSPLMMVEIQIGNYADEDDVVRLLDEYGRC